MQLLWARVCSPAGSRERAELPARCDLQWFSETFCGAADLSEDIDGIDPHLLCTMMHDAIAMLACCPDALDHFFEVEAKLVQPLVPSTDNDKKQVSSRVPSEAAATASVCRHQRARLPRYPLLTLPLLGVVAQGITHMCIGVSRKMSGVPDANQLRSLFTFGLNPKLAMGAKEYEKVLQARSQNGKSYADNKDAPSLTGAGDERSSCSGSELDSFDDQGSYDVPSGDED